MIFVTGGTGFLGSHLLRALVQAGKPVRALYRREIPVQLSDIRDKVEWVKGDVLDVFSLEEALQGVTQVYHAAATVSFQPGAGARMIHTNAEGTANIVNACLDAGVQKLLHVSSVAALGRSKTAAPIDEKAEWEESKNNSAYAISKYRSEMEVWRGIAEGLNAVIINPSIILGTGFWDDGSGALVKNAWKEFPYYTTGINGFVDVQDVVKAMLLLMDSDVAQKRFVVSAVNWSYQDLFTQLAQAMHKKPPHIAVKPWMAEVVWRMEKIKGSLSGKKPLVTKETARTAQLKVYYNNERLLKALPGFTYKPMEQSLREIGAAYLQYLEQ
ncbi:3-beta hydroxysteroid dehydrogenase [Chitinophaga parva]|uniref:3-beta hydroxysteroid dehydrogenase n=1 Tax=Chitinophaga parva TaxID=2169414 RepID=A0A2T7BLF1_9BACT|nr:NAD-dependent epimerase/dehydratase family protein [Chitinophaga parva]PUZ28486.1 3-beta hydroxysteroid dehydrogenase [Chitinophaga parva]